MLKNYYLKKQAILSAILFLIGGLLVACNTSAAATEAESTNTTQTNYAGKKNCMG